MTATTATLSKRFFLKRYPAVRAVLELEEHFQTIRRVSEAFKGHHGVIGFAVVAADSSKRLLLTAETPGFLLSSPRARWPKVSSRAWRGVGTWLEVLHSVDASNSESRQRELRDYSIERINRWEADNGDVRELASDARKAVECVYSSLKDRAIPVTLCHGDITVNNILVSDIVGLVDMDDLRVDMPAVDLSQALIEIREVARVGWFLPLPHLAAAGVRSFVAGYGPGLPAGPEFWLPHLRNLSVSVLTLAARVGQPGISRIPESLRYRRTLVELRQSVLRILRSSGEEPYLRTA